MTEQTTQPETAAEPVETAAVVSETVAEGVVVNEEAETPAERPKLTVKKRKVAEGVVVNEEAETPAEQRGRTETDAGPVQLSAVRIKPREEDELSGPGGIVIIRQRF